MEAKLESLIAGNLRIEVAIGSAEAPTLKWVGRSDMRDPASVLTPYFFNVAKTLSGKSLTIDFRQLEFMNSSTALPIINFCRELEQQKVQTQIIFNSQRASQQTSFAALKAVCSMLDYITLEGRV